ncbi:hypothetical protein JXR93_01405 [bacterium]|nr:hypothetical protein [bacterium]
MGNIDVKFKENVFSFVLPKKQDLIDFFERFLTSYFIEDFTVSYSPILKETFPDKFSVEDIESPNKDQLEVFKDLLNQFYLDKKNFDKVSLLMEKKLQEEYKDYPDYFIYLKAILMSVSFQVQPLYLFQQKERDLILKKQDSNYGISSEIDAEKDENNADINTDMYSGWIDLRAIDSYNNFRKNQAEEKLNKNVLIVDIYTHSEFLALFEVIFQRFMVDSNYPMIDTYSLL